MDQLHRERGHWETEYQWRNHEARSGRGHRGGNRTWVQTSTEVGRGGRRRSKSTGSATSQEHSRETDRWTANQQRDSSCPGYNIKQQRQEFQEARQYGPDRQGGDWYNGHPRTYSRDATPTRGMQPSFFWDGGVAFSEKIIINFVGKQKGGGKT